MHQKIALLMRKIHVAQDTRLNAIRVGQHGAGAIRNPRHDNACGFALDRHRRRRQQIHQEIGVVIHQMPDDIGVLLKSPEIAALRMDAPDPAIGAGADQLAQPAVSGREQKDMVDEDVPAPHPRPGGTAARLRRRGQGERLLDENMLAALERLGAASSKCCDAWLAITTISVAGSVKRSSTRAVLARRRNHGQTPAPPVLVAVANPAHFEAVMPAESCAAISRPNTPTSMISTVKRMFQALCRDVVTLAFRRPG